MFLLVHPNMGLSYWQESALDSFLLIAVSYSSLWFLVVKPTTRKISEDNLRLTAAIEDAKKFRLYVENAEEGFGMATLDKKIIYANTAMSEIVDYDTPDDFIGKDFTSFYTKNDREKLDKKVVPKLMTTGNWRGELTLLTKKGEPIPTEQSHFLVRDDDFEPLYFAAVITDITERRKSEELLRLNYEVMKAAKNGIVVTDSNEKIVMINPAFTEVTGYTEEEVLGKKPNFLVMQQRDKDFLKKMWQSIHKTGSWEGEVWNRRKDGTAFVEWLNISAIKNKQRKVTHYMGIFQDITSRKRLEVKLTKLAKFDGLTGLNNRLAFEEKVIELIKQAKRKSKKMFIFFMDLDHFKKINDHYGHHMGDQLLKEIGRRLTNTLREVDVIARFGGDEFVICLPDVNEKDNAAIVAKKILSVLEQPIELDSHRFFMHASIGISCYPDDGVTIEKIIEAADQAMYFVKQHSRGNFRFYDKGDF